MDMIARGIAVLNDDIRRIFEAHSLNVLLRDFLPLMDRQTVIFSGANGGMMDRIFNVRALLPDGSKFSRQFARGLPAHVAADNSVALPFLVCFCQIALVRRVWTRLLALLLGFLSLALCAV